MPSKISKTKLKMRMTRTTSSGKTESSSQPPAKTIKTSAESYHYGGKQQYHHHQRQKSQGDSGTSDSQSKISNTPSMRSNASSNGNLLKRNQSNAQLSKSKQQHQGAVEPNYKESSHHQHQRPVKSSQSSTSSEEKHCELDGPIYKRYTIKTRLGKGAYGIVWEAYEKTTGNKVALKKIFDAFRNDTDAQRTYREIMFLREFGNHPNIIRLLNVHRAVNNMDIYLVFPFMEHDLHKVIKESPQMLKDSHIRMIFYQTLKAVKYLHSGDVIHRDLKPANILLDDYLNVKVADFGLARSLSCPDDSLAETNPVMTDYVATRWYRPPEILLSCPVYTKGVDMWSLGCILGEMILKVPLFPGGSTVHQVETIMAHIAPPTPQEIEEMCGQNVQTTMIESAMVYRRKSLAEIFERCDADTIDLMERFLVFNPAKRITAEETLAHPYLARYRRQAEELTMSHPVSPPLNDYVQLPMCQYRSVIYDLIQVRKSRQQYHHQSQQQSHYFIYQQPQQRPETTVPVSTSKSRTSCTSTSQQQHQPSQSNPNEARGRVRDLSRNNTAMGKPAQDNYQPRKCHTVKTVQAISREKVRTASPSCEYSPKAEGARSTSLEVEVMAGGGNGRQDHAMASANNRTVQSTTTAYDANVVVDRGTFRQPTRKNNSTPNIPQVRKVPGPDGDGYDVPFPYLKPVATAPGLQGKNPRLFDRSELSARTTHPVPTDFRGADKRLFEIFSQTEDLEEEIKAIEQEVRIKRVANSAQAQWIADLSSNLTKTTVSDPPTTFTGPSTSHIGGKNNVTQFQMTNMKGGGRILQSTKLPEILQTWNQSGQPKVHSSSTEGLTRQQGRRSTYFQDPPAALAGAGTLSVVKSSSSSGNNQRCLGAQGRLSQSQLSPRDPCSQPQQQRLGSSCYPHQTNQSSQYSRCTTPIEVTQQGRSKHYESYSQTHGTISASDLTELKANIGFLGKS